MFTEDPRARAPVTGALSVQDGGAVPQAPGAPAHVARLDLSQPSPLVDSVTPEPQHLCGFRWSPSVGSGDKQFSILGAESDPLVGGGP